MTPDELIQDQGQYPVLTANKAFILGYTDDSHRTQNDIPRIVFDDFTMDSKYVDFPFSVRSSAIKLLKSQNVGNLYFAYLLLNNLHFPQLGHARHYISYVQTRHVEVPTITEQNSISDFFQTLDSLIAAAERKRELLKLKKQAFLQRMFPKRGETRPRLRFAGFTEDWEHQRIGTIIRTYLRRDYLASEIHGKGAFPVIQQGDSPIAGYSDGKSFNAYEQVVLFGDHTLSLYKPSSPFLLATDGVQIIGSDKISACFLFFLLERYLPSDRGYKRHLSQLKSAYCSFPPTNEEQQLVGNFFKQIDSLISSCESQIRVLQQLKQGYMQQMFV